MRFSRSIVTVLAVLMAFLAAGAAQAIVIIGGNGRLTRPPEGALAQSGIQYTGTWGSFSGTAIGPHYFITAAHVRGSVGEPFLLHGKLYFATAEFPIRGSDLAIWRVAGTFPRWAKLYENDDEVGQPIVLYGRGGRRGPPVVVNGLLRGWLWGTADGVLAWGTNFVQAIAPMEGNSDVLAFAFNAYGGPLEATVTPGDSGGGVFVRQNNEWKLVGVNFAVNGRYSRFADGHGAFMASIVDGRGLYQLYGNHWVLNPLNSLFTTPTVAFATRISPHVKEIQAILAGRENAHARHPISRTVEIVAVSLGLIVVGIIAGVGWTITRRRRSRASGADTGP